MLKLVQGKSEKKACLELHSAQQNDSEQSSLLAQEEEQERIQYELEEQARQATIQREEEERRQYELEEARARQIVREAEDLAEEEAQREELDATQRKIQATEAAKVIEEEAAHKAALEAKDEMIRLAQQSATRASPDTTVIHSSMPIPSHDWEKSEELEHTAAVERQQRQQRERLYRQIATQDPRAHTDSIKKMVDQKAQPAAMKSPAVPTLSLSNVSSQITSPPEGVVIDHLKSKTTHVGAVSTLGTPRQRAHSKLSGVSATLHRRVEERNRLRASNDDLRRSDLCHLLGPLYY